MSERVSDERILELISDAEDQHHEAQDSPHYAGLSRDTAAALRELQQWRSGVEPSTGSPIGTFVVMEPWTDDTE